MPPALGQPTAHDSQVFRRVEGMLRLMPRCIPEQARGDDVLRDILTAIASRFDVFRRTLKPLRQTR